MKRASYQNGTVSEASERAWHTLIHAVHYLLMKPDCTRDDLSAGRLLNQKAFELIARRWIH